MKGHAQHLPSHRDLYILVAGEPVEEDCLLCWAEWYETANRRVAREELGDLVVSTVFLGIDHGFGLTPRPLVFETMVFRGKQASDMVRSSSLVEARDAHRLMVAKVRECMPATNARGRAIDEGCMDPRD